MNIKEHGTTMNYFGSYTLKARKQAYTKYVEDRSKIEDKLKQLNGGELKGKWDESDGFVMMPSVKISQDKKTSSVAFDSGIALKLFVNTETGEVETFWAHKFMKN